MTPESEDFPKAIIQQRPGPLAERFDRLARVLGDPLVTLFTLQQSLNEDTRHKAAAELMPYRYRRLKPQEDPQDAALRAPPVLVQINFQDSSKQVSLVSSGIPSTDPLD
jgi:hypothetical protein